MPNDTQAHTYNAEEKPKPNDEQGTGTDSLGGGIFWFGILLGFLTAICSQVGITATLIGLLFAAFGSSFVAWFRPRLLEDPTILPKLSNMLRLISIGVLWGLGTGMVLRTVDQAFLEPWIKSRQADEIAKVTLRSRIDTLLVHEIGRLQKSPNSLVQQEILSSIVSLLKGDSPPPASKKEDDSKAGSPAPPVVKQTAPSPIVAVQAVTSSDLESFLAKTHLLNFQIDSEADRAKKLLIQQLNQYLNGKRVMAPLSDSLGKLGVAEVSDEEWIRMRNKINAELLATITASQIK